MNANSQPIVSVVMPVYNTAQYLEEAVESVLCQTLQNLELIAVNDGSTDRSGSILDRYAAHDRRIKVVHQENRGISAARNRGMKEAAGKYIAVMDSDDICLPNRLAKQVSFMENNPDVAVLGSRCSFFGEGNEKIGVCPPLTPEIVKSKLLFLPTLSHTSVIMRHNLVTKYDLYYDENLLLAEDYELYTRFIKYGRIANLPDVLMKIRTHSNSTTRRLRNAGNEYLREVHKRILSQLNLNPTSSELDLHLSISISRFQKSREYVESAERWLCKILDANEKTGFCKPEALARTLFERWFALCAHEYEFGLWTLQKMISSKLYAGWRDLGRVFFSFAIRCLLRRKSLRFWVKAVDVSK